MEFHEKLGQLRKQRGLTQQALAEALYVSRTAVSKWESGRGYPSIESLRMIADFFSLTVDELLSPREVLALAEENQKQLQTHFRDLVLGLADLLMALLLFLPFFAQRTAEGIHESSLLSLVGVSPFLKFAYLFVVIGSVVFGILLLALQNFRAPLFKKSKTYVSVSLGAGAVLLFTVSLQPYAATFAFALLLVKGFLLIKRP